MLLLQQNGDSSWLLLLLLQSTWTVAFSTENGCKCKGSLFYTIWPQSNVSSNSTWYQGCISILHQLLSSDLVSVLALPNQFSMAVFRTDLFLSQKWLSLIAELAYTCLAYTCSNSANGLVCFSIRSGAIIRDGDRKRAQFLVLGLAPWYGTIFLFLEQIAPSPAAHARTLLRGFSRMSRRGNGVRNSRNRLCFWPTTQRLYGCWNFA